MSSCPSPSGDAAAFYGRVCVRGRRRRRREEEEENPQSKPGFLFVPLLLSGPSLRHGVKVFFLRVGDEDEDQLPVPPLPSVTIKRRLKHDCISILGLSPWQGN